MQLRFRIAAITAALLMYAGVARADGNTVVMGQINLSFYAVTAAVVHEVLDRLGHRVEVRSGSHGEMFPALGKGEIDILVAAWLPSGHAVYWEQYGKDSMQLATLYSNAQIYWSVPLYVPASQVSSVADLKKPEVAQKMVKVIRGTAPDSGLVIGSRKIMEKYQGTQRSRRKVRQGVWNECECGHAASVPDSGPVAHIHLKFHSIAFFASSLFFFATFASTLLIWFFCVFSVACG